MIIDARSRTKIKIDGPSLIVQNTDKALRRFPTRLLRKIIVIGGKLKGLQAITECATQQISVFFVSDNGDIKAQMLGMYPSNAIWEDWLDQCLWHENWKHDYVDAVDSFRTCMLSQSNIFDPEMCRKEQLCNEWMRGYLNSNWGKKRSRDSKQWLMGFTEIIAAKTMHEMGIPTTHGFGRRIVVDAKNLVMTTALMDCCKNKRIKPIDNPEAVGKFYQEYCEDWRSLLLRLFLFLEHRFNKLDANVGMKDVK
ncbi:MAG: CRISPR-associated endonuclease Cas1 [Gammaproteobacteria bacterium]|nr:CRISPR-associated endonuclease Cas1 [Gammaproteobacteria bacterium]